ncbi:hypothetical protein Ancab_011502 [Ancistrocladus abbreviatus]
MFSLKNEEFSIVGDSEVVGSSGSSVSQFQDSDSSLLRNVSPTEWILYMTIRPTDNRTAYEKMLENDVEFGSPDERSGGFLDSELVNSYTCIHFLDKSDDVKRRHISWLLADNSLNGSVPSSIWQSRKLNATERLILLRGNPLCTNSRNVHLCGSLREDDGDSQDMLNSTALCLQACPPPYEKSPASPECFCAAPLLVGYRLKGLGFSDFRPYRNEFQEYLSSGLDLYLN